jgi:hypothetical protein
MNRTFFTKQHLLEFALVMNMVFLGLWIPDNIPWQDRFFNVGIVFALFLIGKPFIQSLGLIRQQNMLGRRSGFWMLAFGMGFFFAISISAIQSRASATTEGLFFTYFCMGAAFGILMAFVQNINSSQDFSKNFNLDHSIIDVIGRRVYTFTPFVIVAIVVVLLFGFEVTDRVFYPITALLCLFWPAYAPAGSDGMRVMSYLTAPSQLAGLALVVVIFASGL